MNFAMQNENDFVQIIQQHKQLKDRFIAILHVLCYNPSKFEGLLDGVVKTAFNNQNDFSHKNTYLAASSFDLLQKEGILECSDGIISLGVYNFNLEVSFEKAEQKKSNHIKVSIPTEKFLELEFTLYG